ncbi:VPLPA-CTERM sorting domain-containing protein [Methylomonas sp. 2BW1-5-20]|uniref:VPLPA-CTERM sorting domain-containing protein n=1 Tax=Methylomonas sp. 2BW1-5-20 TaxID=3376686 RepID=UPI0040531082
MRNRLVKSVVALFLSAASLQASADVVTFSSQEFQQTANGQSFIFTIENAPLAALVDGSLFIHARGDYSENSDIENIAFSIDGVSFPDKASPYDGATVTQSYHPDVVEWSQEFLLNGSDLVNWTNDQKIVITLALSSDVEYNLFAGGETALHPPFVQATLIYTTSAVPLPAATWLFLSGLVGMIGYGRQRRSN